MSHYELLDTPVSPALELFHIRPGIYYSLDATAELTGVSRRTIAIYCRAGLLRPAYLPPYGVMAFEEDAIHVLRRLEHLRTAHGLDLPWMRTMIDLLTEVESLRAEVRFLRAQ